MSTRIGVPAHQVIRVLLDRYVQRLPSARQKFAELLRRPGERTIQ